MKVVPFQTQSTPLALAGHWALCALYLTAGCSGRTVDLDTDPGRRDDTVFIVDPQPVSGVWVDGARLYWTATGDSSTELKGCDVDACPETTTTYGRVDGGHNELIAVGGGRVAWAELDTLRTCSASGCDGEPQEIVRGAQPRSLACDKTHVCFSEDSATYCCPASGCNTPPDFVALGPGAGPLIIGGEYLYWGNTDEVRRTRLDELGPATLVTTTTGYSIRLDVTSTSLYLVELVGPTACPLPSCSEHAPLVAGALDLSNVFVSEIRADDSHVYWLEASLGQLKRCALSGCAEPELALSNHDHVAQFALGADYLYWIESTQGQSSPFGPFDVAIRRVRK